MQEIGVQCEQFSAQMRDTTKFVKRKKNMEFIEAEKYEEFIYNADETDLF